MNPARIAVIPSKRFDDAIINASAASYLLHSVQHDGAPQNCRRVHRDSTDRGAGAESAAIPLSVGGLPVHWSLQSIEVCALSTVARRRKTRVYVSGKRACSPWHYMPVRAATANVGDCACSARHRNFLCIGARRTYPKLTTLHLRFCSLMGRAYMCTSDLFNNQTYFSTIVNHIKSKTQSRLDILTTRCCQHVGPYDLL